MEKLCECGCGGTAPVCTSTNLKKGRLKGSPLRFIHGHNRRNQGPEYEVDEATGCWNWLLGSNGRYGSLNNVLAHKLHFEKCKGPVPEGFEIDHLCRNKLCVNPDHLEAVTHAVNMARRFAHERKVYGRTLGGRPKKAA